MPRFREWLRYREQQEDLNQILAVLADAVEGEDWSDANQIVQQADQAVRAIYQHAAQIAGLQGGNPTQELYGYFQGGSEGGGDIRQRYEVIDYLKEQLDRVKGQGFERLQAAVGDKYDHMKGRTPEGLDAGPAKVNQWMHQMLLPTVNWVEQLAGQLSKGRGRWDYEQGKPGAKPLGQGEPGPRVPATVNSPGF